MSRSKPLVRSKKISPAPNKQWLCWFLWSLLPGPGRTTQDILSIVPCLFGFCIFCILFGLIGMGDKTKESVFPDGCFLKWWYPQNTPKWSKMDHFSRKTDGCWAPSLLGNPQIKRGLVDLPIGFSVGSRRVTHHAAVQLFQNALFLGFSFFFFKFLNPKRLVTGERCFSWKNIWSYYSDLTRPHPKKGS